jgi:hypothetical protein
VNSIFIAELDDALQQRLAGTKWEAMLTKFTDATPWEDRIALYQALRAEHVFPDDATYFLIAWAIEALAMERADDLYETMYAKRFETIRRAHGLDEDEEWEPGTGPKEYEALDAEYADAVNAISRSTYQRFGEHKMADLLEKDPDEANRRYEAGHTYINDVIDESLRE